MYIVTQRKTKVKTIFNPENKDVLSYKESLAPAMEITEQEDADQYLEALIAYHQKWLDREPRTDDKTAEDITKINLGYYAGYYSHRTRIRVEALFRCNHPIFGKAMTYKPTPLEAIVKGIEMGNKHE